MKIINNDYYKIELINSQIIKITERKRKKNKSRSIDLKELFFGNKSEINLSVDERMRDKNLAVFSLSPEEFENTGEFAANGYSTASIRIYTGQSKKTIYVLMLRSLSDHYHKMIHFQSKNENIHFKRNKLAVSLDCCIYSRWHNDVDVSKIELVIDRNHRFQVDLPIHEEEGEYTSIKQVIPLDSIIAQETEINNPINIEITTNDGVVTPYRIGFKDDNPKPLKYNFCPFDSKFYKKHALYLRGTLNHKYVFMIRPMEPIEKKLGFKIKESRLVSSFMYHVIGKYKSRNKGKKINLFYEKNSEKAEEGTFQLFEKCLESKTSHNYYILSDESIQWKELSKHKNVVRKYSWKYYFLLYTASNFIATEGSSHLNILRSININLRKTLLESHFVFLQHGLFT